MLGWAEPILTQEHLWERGQTLDDAWDKFVMEREGWGEAREKREAATRADLEERAPEFIKDSEALSERRGKLQAKINGLD